MRWVHRPRRSSLQPFEQRFEIGKAGADRRHIVDLDRRLADQPGDREAHADAVVEVAGDGRAAGKRIAAVAVDDQPVRCFLDTRADRREAGRHYGEAVAFLDAKLVEAGRDGAPFGECGGADTDREFVDHARRVRRVDAYALARSVEARAAGDRPASAIPGVGAVNYT